MRMIAESSYFRDRFMLRSGSIFEKASDHTNALLDPLNNYNRPDVTNLSRLSRASSLVFLKAKLTIAVIQPLLISDHYIYL